LTAIFCQQHEKSWILWLLATLSLPLLFTLLFVANSYWPGSRTLESGLTPFPPGSSSLRKIKMMSYNIRWCKKSEGCLDQVAALIKEEKPDIVFLAAIYYECAQCTVNNQVSYLANKAGLHSYAFGENYSFGLPFYRNRSGNALLSRLPLRARYTQPLSGASYKPRSKKNALWAEVELNGKNMLVGSVHNSHSNQEKNLDQVGELLAYADDQPAILGGDFNTTPKSPSMQKIRSSGRFIGDFDGQLTYPTSSPEERLDYILAPSSWQALEHKTLKSDASAHLPVVSTFAIPPDPERPL
jgi:endonuclease/exonuclease/phosphatase family metal-dependent hydrolase